MTRLCALALAATSLFAEPLSRQQMELFLKTAKLEKTQAIPVGTTKPLRATLSDGKITHDANVQCVEVFQKEYKFKGYYEKNFRDSYKFNIAAYELDKLLNLNMIPPSVEREVDGKWCALTWWVEDVIMTEEERRKAKTQPPNLERWVDQLNIVRVFDQLIYNMDRNQGNLLIDKNWKLWMIDHTRAFRTSPAVKDPKELIRIDYRVFDNLKNLDAAAVGKALAPYLRPEEIRALMARRDRIVKYFDSEIVRRGRDEMLSNLPRSTPHVTIPPRK